jgi:hypothetical protein
MAIYVSICYASIKYVQLQEKPSALKREHPALQNMKFIYFFQFLWVILAHLDPDPDPDALTNPDPKLGLPQCGSGTKVDAKTFL